jgi:hypothetical protein
MKSLYQTLLALVLMATATADVPELGLRVKSAKLCEIVDENRDPINEFKQPDKVLKGPVSLWTVLSGDEKTLHQLRRRGLLPIQHRWYRAATFAVVPVAVEEFDDGEPIRVGTIHHLAKLGAEVAMKGAFDWRTWSCKRALLPGTYLVKVVFSDGTPVIDLNGRSCEVSFTYSPE